MDSVLETNTNFRVPKFKIFISSVTFKISKEILVSSTVVVLLFFILEAWWRNSNEALGDEDILLLTSLTGLNLFHHLSTGNAFLSTSLELAHVVSITLDLLLFGIDTACIQGGNGRRNTEKCRSGSESLEQNGNDKFGECIRMSKVD